MKIPGFFALGLPDHNQITAGVAKYGKSRKFEKCAAICERENLAEAATT
jgi:hypothetical protein